MAREEKKKKQFCHWIPAKGHARVKVPSSHTPRVIKKCDFGEKKKGKEMKRSKVSPFIYLFFHGKGLTQKQDKN